MSSPTPAAIEAYTVYYSHFASKRRLLAECVKVLMEWSYPQLGAEFEVVHRTEYLAGLVASGRLKLGSKVNDSATGRKRVTYHDSCYLGRYNGILDEPRRLLAAAGHDLVELPRKGSQALCCGAGGGRMWLEEDEGERINLLRTDEVLGISPDIAAVARPYCLTMLKDGVDDREAGDRVRVMNIAEVLAEARGA
jgi:Fe-S oxidoreductase